MKRLLGATIIALLAATGSARADVTIKGDLIVRGGSTDEVWRGLVQIVAGSIDRDVWGDLLIDAQAQGSVASGGNCSQDSQCASGECVAGICCDQRCDSGCGTCSSGTCSPAPEYTACSDGLGTTFGDQCDGNGMCVGTSIAGSCPENTTCATYTPRNDGTPFCDVSYATAGTACNDGLSCTSATTCDGQGACR